MPPRPRDEQRLFDVALKDDKQLSKPFLAFARVCRPGDALMGVLMNDNFGEGLECFSRRHDLSQDIDAIAVFLHHVLDGLELADDFAQANLQRPLFCGSVNMLGRGHHGKIDRFLKLEQFRLGFKGYGGILHL